MKGIRFAVLALLVFQSVTHSQVKAPLWAKDAVWYQIFPERFRNGDSKNDPTAAELHLNANREWHISPWTSDWYKLQPWEEQHSKNFYENVFERRYGGDLQGVIDRIDYLAYLGVTAIYFNPVFEAVSLHKYDASTYHHIDNNFGPKPKNDLEIIKSETDDPQTWRWSAADSLFLNLIRKAHVRGIKIVIDGVFNHCGTDFWALQDVMKNQQKSHYADWFDVTKWDDPSTPQTEFDYKGWWGYKPMPEFREDENGFSKPVWEYFFNITRRWMDPNRDGNPSDGIDGWRLDVANDVSHKFWIEWRKLVKSINPDAYIVGEIWDDASNWLSGDQFDAVMNYRFARACVKFFIDTNEQRYSATAFDKELSDVRKSYPAEVNYILQNLLDSHDTDRLPSMIMNPNRKYDDNNGLRNNSDYNINKPTNEVRRIQRLMLLFQMTYLGAPMVYYGDEAGMWGADDPDDRKPMVWADLKYENESSHPIAEKKRTNDAVKFDQEMYAYYKRIISIRKQNGALRRGTFETLLTDDAKAVYAFERTYEKNNVIVVFNNSAEQQSVEVPRDGVYKEQLTGKETKSGNGKLQLILQPKSGMVLVKR